MTKKDIVRQLAVDLQVDQTLTRKIVQGTFDCIVRSLLEDGRIELRNFGVFEIKTRAARKARNPKTNETVMVPPKRVITFQPGKNVASKVDGIAAR